MGMPFRQIFDLRIGYINLTGLEQTLFMFYWFFPSSYDNRSLPLNTLSSIQTGLMASLQSGHDSGIPEQRFHRLDCFDEHGYPGQNALRLSRLTERNSTCYRSCAHSPSPIIRASDDLSCVGNGTSQITFGRTITLSNSGVPGPCQRADAPYASVVRNASTYTMTFSTHYCSWERC